MTTETGSLHDSLRQAATAHETVDPAPLERIYRKMIREIGKTAATRFRERASLTAASVDWQPPQITELVPDTAPENAAAAADKARRAALEEILVDFEVPGLLSQQLLDQLAARADAIAPGVRQPVARVIARSYVNGLSANQTADAIVEAVDGIADYQAAALARTDLVSLGNGGSLLAAKTLARSDAVAPAQWKRWLTAQDELVRPTHAEAEGQTVPLDAPFIVGGSILRYPGDPFGPDEEVINCRCTVVYVDDPAA